MDVETPALSEMDERAMHRLGKTQQLKRQFGPLAMTGFGVVLGASWQSVLTGTLFTLPNGGPTGTVIMYMVVACGLLLTSCSLAEMAAFAPTAGGQYHWVSELAPSRIQKPLSFLIGWTSNLAWQLLAVTSLSGLVAQIEALTVLYHPGHMFPTWQVGLMVMAVLCVCVAFNIGLISLLPSLELAMLVLHMAAYLAVILVMLCMGPRGSPESVFDDFINANSWPSTAIAVLVGSLGIFAALTTADSVCHMAEEVKDASRWLPRIMVFSNGFNYLSGLLFLFAFLFRAGDIESALMANPYQPWVAIMYTITGSIAGTTAITVYVILSLMVSSANMVTTASRQLFAFARDGGVPFSPWVCKVAPSGLPINALVCTLVFGCVVSAIVIGSQIFLNIVTASYLVVLLFSYMISLATLLFRRLTTTLPRTAFSLGVFGVPINVAALLFCTFGWVISSFPPSPAPQASTMNWACVIFSGLLAFPAVFYFAFQHRVYVPPVVRVQRTQNEDLIVDVNVTKSN